MNTRSTPLRITFVLPDVKFSTVSGGYRSRYETADHLARRGHRVVVLHETNSWKIWLRSWTWRLRRRPLADGFVPWYRFTSDVEIRVVRRVRRRHARHTDRLVFTSWTTIALGVRAERTLVHVWDYEFWVEGDDSLRRNMRQAFSQPDLELVAGTAAVAEMLDTMGLAPVAVIPDGIRIDVFRQLVPIGARPVRVGYFHRTAPRRGIPDAIRAFARLRAEVPDVEVHAVGQPGDDVPDWVVVHPAETDADLVDFYNHLAVFLLPSRAEGLGLPAVEAMACGAAVVVTDNGGSRQFAVDGSNALVVPVGDDEAMSDAMTRLLQDEELRARFATSGEMTAAGFGWEGLVDAFEDALR